MFIVWIISRVFPLTIRMLVNTTSLRQTPNYACRLYRSKNTKGSCRPARYLNSHPPQMGQERLDCIQYSGHQPDAVSSVQLSNRVSNFAPTTQKTKGPFRLGLPGRLELVTPGGGVEFQVTDRRLRLQTKAAAVFDPHAAWSLGRWCAAWWRTACRLCLLCRRRRTTAWSHVRPWYPAGTRRRPSPAASRTTRRTLPALCLGRRASRRPTTASGAQAKLGEVRSLSL